ncbi:MAG: hypothetical protein FWH29_05105 [Methanobrevibacter sp.]|nr:hypothetical protein [Methanobrevibacter sp.]
MEKKLKTFGNNTEVNTEINNTEAKIASKKWKIADFNVNSYKNSTIINKFNKILIHLSRISIEANCFYQALAIGLVKFKNYFYNNQSYFNILHIDNTDTNLNFNIFNCLSTTFFIPNLTCFNSHNFSILNKINFFNYSTFFKNNFFRIKFLKNNFSEKNYWYSLNFKSYNIKYTSFFNENSCFNSYTKYIAHFNRSLANAIFNRFTKVISYFSFYRNFLVLMRASYFFIATGFLKIIYHTYLFTCMMSITGGISLLFKEFS